MKFHNHRILVKYMTYQCSTPSDHPLMKQKFEVEDNLLNLKYAIQQ